MERGRARAFMDMLAQKQVARERTGDVFRALQALDQKIRVERQKNHYSGNGEEGLAPSLKERGQLLDQLYRDDPELAALFSTRNPPLAQVQKSLRKGEVIAYAVPALRDHPLSFLLIRSDSTQLLELKADIHALNRLLAILQRNIYAQGRRSGMAVQKLSAELSDMLELNRWGEIERLYVVPAGELFFLPWGMIPTTYPVSVLPMGSWLLRKSAVIQASLNAGVLGDPEYGGDFPALPGAREEAAEVSIIYEVNALLGEHATEAALRTSMGSGVRTLHLATHGLFDPNNPLNSGLILSDGKQASRLSAEDLLVAPLPAQVVILSACETGLGSTIAGDDLLGLSRSFYLGGTTTLLSTLWPVEDRATALFMKHFHQQASATGDIGKAWLSARDTLIQQGFPPESYGAFVLGGLTR